MIFFDRGWAITVKGLGMANRQAAVMLLAEHEGEGWRGLKKIDFSVSVFSVVTDDLSDFSAMEPQVLARFRALCFSALKAELRAAKRAELEIKLSARRCTEKPRHFQIHGAQAFEVSPVAERDFHETRAAALRTVAP